MTLEETRAGTRTGQARGTSAPGPLATGTGGNPERVTESAFAATARNVTQNRTLGDEHLTWPQRLALAAFIALCAATLIALWLLPLRSITT